MGYFFVFLTIALTVYGQVVLKWQVSELGSFPAGWLERLDFFRSLLQSPWVLTALAAAFLAFLAWAIALTKLDLSHAYPLTSLAFVSVVFCGWAIFGETLSAIRLLGLGLVILGVILGSQG
jgi:multidrug transporter EmrE-like cation transporter